MPTADWSRRAEKCFILVWLGEILHRIMWKIKLRLCDRVFIIKRLALRRCLLRLESRVRKGLYLAIELVRYMFEGSFLCSWVISCIVIRSSTWVPVLETEGSKFMQQTPPGWALGQVQVWVLSLTYRTLRSGFRSRVLQTHKKARSKEKPMIRYVRLKIDGERENENKRLYLSWSYSVITQHGLWRSLSRSIKSSR